MARKPRPLAGFDGEVIGLIRAEVWYEVAAVARPVCCRSPRTVRSWLGKPGCVLVAKPDPSSRFGGLVISGESLLAFAGHLVARQAGRDAGGETRRQVKRRADEVMAGIK